jgi:hypothetical protein
MSEKDRPKPPQSQPEEMPEESTPDDVIPGPVTGADVEAAIRGMEFPASARDLIDRARRNGADENVLHRLADLVERRYTSLGDALRSLDMLS